MWAQRRNLQNQDHVDILPILSNRQRSSKKQASGSARKPPLSSLKQSKGSVSPNRSKKSSFGGRFWEGRKIIIFYSVQQREGRKESYLLKWSQREAESTKILTGCALIFWQAIGKNCPTSLLTRSTHQERSNTSLQETSIGLSTLILTSKARKAISSNAKSLEYHLAAKSYPGPCSMLMLRIRNRSNLQDKSGNYPTSSFYPPLRIGCIILKTSSKTEDWHFSSQPFLRA